MRAAARDTAGLMWAPDTGRKIVASVSIASPELSPQYTFIIRIKTRINFLRVHRKQAKKFPLTTYFKHGFYPSDQKLHFPHASESEYYLNVK